MLFLLVVFVKVLIVIFIILNFGMRWLSVLVIVLVGCGFFIFDGVDEIDIDF